MIKSFIYLDENKMYSISSQLFEGMTQYILQENVVGNEERDEQKGAILSGRFMADMMFQQRTTSEMKSLHDFAFNLFENELLSRELLYDIQDTDSAETLKEKGFVRVKGKIFFSDYAKTLFTIDHFNEIGKAVGSLQLQPLLQQINDLGNGATKEKEREKKNKKQIAIKEANKRIDEFLKQNGLQIEEKMVKNISTILSYGYRDSYEVKLVIDNVPIIYSAIVNQDYLKEPEHVLVSKYSRLTEKEFTIVGIVTQVGKEKTKLPQLEGNEMKGATQFVNEQIANLEEQFSGRSTNEIIIDPIAIFSEL